MTDMPPARPAGSAVLVRGHATAEELAVVLALVATPRTLEPSAYARWRSTRLAALRRDQPA